MPTKPATPPPFDLQELLLKGIFKGFTDFIVMFWPYILILIAITVIKWKLEGKAAKAKKASREKQIRRDEEIREEVREERRRARR